MIYRENIICQSRLEKIQKRSSSVATEELKQTNQDATKKPSVVVPAWFTERVSGQQGTHREKTTKTQRH